MVKRRYISPENLISELGITTPQEIDINVIAAHCNAFVEYEHFEGSSGHILGLDGEAIISVNSSMSQERQKFTAAHELGHWMCDRGKASIAHRDTDEGIELGWADQNREYRANQFAARLLMPERFLADECNSGKPSMAKIDRLARRFGVSFSAAAYRFVECCHERCALVISKNKTIHSFIRSKDFGFWIPVKRKLDQYSIAYDFFQDKPLSKYMESVDASAWLEGKYIDDALIKEESRQIGNLKATRSLLWIDNHIDIDNHDWDDREKFTPDGSYI